MECQIQVTLWLGNPSGVSGNQSGRREEWVPRGLGGAGAQSLQPRAKSGDLGEP